jgi:glutathione S-transferase
MNLIRGSLANNRFNRVCAKLSKGCIRLETFRWGLRGLARLSEKEKHQLQALLNEGNHGEQLANFYEGYNTPSIPDTAYMEHLLKLNDAFRIHEQTLQDGRSFLTVNDLTMAGIIWAMKTQWLTECEYPFEQCPSAYYAWFQRISSRPSFQKGVMGKHKFKSAASRAQANIEHLLGIGSRKEVRKHVA